MHDLNANICRNLSITYCRALKSDIRTCATAHFHYPSSSRPAECALCDNMCCWLLAPALDSPLRCSSRPLFRPIFYEYVVCTMSNIILKAIQYIIHPYIRDLRAPTHRQNVYELSTMKDKILQKSRPIVVAFTTSIHTRDPGGSHFMLTKSRGVSAIRIFAFFPSDPPINSGCLLCLPGISP